MKETYWPPFWHCFMIKGISHEFRNNFRNWNYSRYLKQEENSIKEFCKPVGRTGGMD